MEEKERKKNCWEILKRRKPFLLQAALRENRKPSVQLIDERLEMFLPQAELLF